MTKVEELIERKRKAMKKKRATSWKRFSIKKPKNAHLEPLAEVWDRR